MKFVALNPFPFDVAQVGQDVRNIVDSLNDGKHEISISTGTFDDLTVNQSAIMSNLNFGRASGGTLFAISANITSGTFVGLSSTTGTITTLGSTSGTIQTLINAGHAAITSASITTMSLGYTPRLSAASIYGTSGNFDYALLASANITTALIASATITSATITGAKIGTLQGLLKGTAGTVSALASGTTAQFLRGDISMQAISSIVDAGIYTPTFAKTVNVATAGMNPSMWTRISNIVSTWGYCTIDPTSASVLTVLDVSLPVPSNLANNYDLCGTGSGDQTANCPIEIEGTVATDTAQLVFVPQSLANRAYSYTFAYQVK